ncbi:methyltransferase domain-containing protein [Haloferax sp. MBLA0076]|uniref:Methyltransferase domain-containing protein n=1 Tax=Haloferax litoreum TaxID=2666140 RepID=A0A6A8GJA3_9EURY|nr:MULTISPECIES: class I SAM-dependent methyltransferase [Haloferax]KAB1194683.1 class I SAM-dependent methyltransferase [Haloferax sp. CBA1148]MRX23263.1 methyltransferase domain-containing protein [Haloferax litoreum]
MKKTIEEHAARFSEVAPEYDESQDSDEYRACVSLVVHYADPSPDDVVLDLGTGTGAIALALAPDAKHVIGRDISEGMLEQARAKAAEVGIENVDFGVGRFRDPNVDADDVHTGSSETPQADARDARVDIVVSNFAMHHLSDEEKREAIQVVADLEPRRFVLGDVMFFGEPNPDEPFYSPEVDDPSTVGFLADALTDAGFVLTAVEAVHEQVGVLVAERAPSFDEGAE